MSRLLRVACFAGLVMVSCGTPTLHAQDNHPYASTANTPKVIARGGGFPALQPRSSAASNRETPDRGVLDHDSSTHGASTPIGQLGNSTGRDSRDFDDQSTYRVAGSATSDGDADFQNEEDAAAALRLERTPEPSRSKMTGPLVTVCSSLAIVLALFSALVWVGRRFGGGAAASKPLPAAALHPLGHIMLDPRTKLVLVKCGRRILVLSQTASGVQPITEVTHPDEVRELVASCSAEAREVFERTLREIELEPAHGFTGQSDEAVPRPTSRRSSGRLFATA
ncbi:flagellar biosynthetic protein FliO [Neorhodopirellula lusitana]|uniref:Flagellar biosynthetic protein FliO n=1 Tax=Neorhodopirellula lusitana TaxID=445327 RepID=A0ABY1QRS6_9BACT|nr:flagellar biosynthetic protein FliO [Neorhodopirellula lusitana]SMP76968.1 flagellar biosynthetic protein FliO [Neorhodopirellula lusitana]